MNVLAVAVKRRLAIFKRRCVEGTKSRGIPIGEQSGVAKEVPRRTDGKETSGIGIRIIWDWNDGHGCRDALGDNASHTNTLTMDYFIVWKKKEISFRHLDL